MAPNQDSGATVNLPAKTKKKKKKWKRTLSLPPEFGLKEIEISLISTHCYFLCALPPRSSFLV